MHAHLSLCFPNSDLVKDAEKPPTKPEDAEEVEVDYGAGAAVYSYGGEKLSGDVIVLAGPGAGGGNSYYFTKDGQTFFVHDETVGHEPMLIAKQMNRNGCILNSNDTVTVRFIRFTRSSKPLPTITKTRTANRGRMRRENTKFWKRR